jgi:UDP-glucose 4-epimerase
MAESAVSVASSALTVAVTGPTGDIGRSLLAALERAGEVERVLGMARRPFDPAERGWKKVEYRRGDVLDRDAVDALVRDADVVVHLAFVILGSHEESRSVNLRGSGNVFEAAVAAPRVRRLVYASSVAAYGFHDDNPALLDEEVPARGTDAHYYSAQKAEVEQMLATSTEGSDLAVYVFRPCIVAGPDAPMLLESIPYRQWGEKLPDAIRQALDAFPGVKPVLPDPGVPFQLVHHDDVAAALVKAVIGAGEPGVYNLAGEGRLTVTDLARALGWHAFPVPKSALDATAELVARLPFVPAEAEWIEAFRRPVLMDTAKARERLGWRPEHDAHATLEATVAANRGGR